MELEIKHLTPYLPYGLKMQYVVREKVEKTGIMKTIIHNEDETHPTKISIDWNNEEHIWMFKPILRPLSDLTKEIQVNGEKFYPLEKLTEIFGGRPISFDGTCFYTKIQENMVRKKEDVVPLHFSQLDAFNKLFEWHFDVFGLIPAGLATDINTL